VIEKSLVGGGAVTVSPTVVLCVALPSVPVTVSVYVPGTAVPALTLSVDALPAVTEVELRFAVAPEGTPVTERLTVPAEPVVTAVLIVDEPAVLAASERLVGAALIEKSLAGGAHPGKVNEAIFVLQLNEPLLFRYSLVYQKVQSLTGSTDMAL